MSELIEKRERLGKVLVGSIAAVHLIGPVLQLLFDFKLSSLLTFILAGLLSLGLWNGIRWIRLLFAAVSGLSVLYTLYLLLGGGIDFNGGAFWIVLLLILQLAYSAAACLLLLFSKSIKEFLYR